MSSALAVLGDIASLWFAGPES